MLPPLRNPAGPSKGGATNASGTTLSPHLLLDLVPDHAATRRKGLAGQRHTVSTRPCSIAATHAAAAAAAAATSRCPLAWQQQRQLAGQRKRWQQAAAPQHGACAYSTQQQACHVRNCMRCMLHAAAGGLFRDIEARYLSLHYKRLVGCSKKPHRVISSPSRSTTGFSTCKKSKWTIAIANEAHSKQHASGSALRPKRAAQPRKPRAAAAAKCRLHCSTAAQDNGEKCKSHLDLARCRRHGPHLSCVGSRQRAEWAEQVSRGGAGG